MPAGCRYGRSRPLPSALYGRRAITCLSRCFLQNRRKSRFAECTVRQNAFIYPHYDDVEVVEYRQPAEGTLREENREDGWLHVFVWQAGNWKKSHRISPGGEECHSSRKSQITANRCVIALPLLGVVGMFAEDIIALTRSNIKMKEGWKIHCKYEPKRQQK